MEFIKTSKKARLQRPLANLCFWTDQKTKMAALANPSLRCMICGPLGDNSTQQLKTPFLCVYYLNFIVIIFFEVRDTVKVTDPALLLLRQVLTYCMFAFLASFSFQNGRSMNC